MTTRLATGQRVAGSRGRVGSWLLVGLAVMVAASLFTVPAIALQAAEAGTIGLRLLDQPSDSAGDPRAQIYIIDHLAPGAEIQRRIEVTTTNTAAQVHLYAAAATITNGSFLGEPGDTPNDLSTWTSVTPGDIDMVSDQVATATVTITVPSDAAPGERYGVVWAEVRSPDTSDGEVTQVNRVGIRLYLSIGPGGPPAPDFSITSLAAASSVDGVRTVVASVSNTGGRALDLSGTLDLDSTVGHIRAGPYPADLGATLGVGATELVTITIDTDLPAGPWNAQITLRSGLVERSAFAELTFPAAGTSPAVATTQFSFCGNGPSLVTVLFPVLVVAGMVTWRRRSLRRTAVRQGEVRHLRYPII
ncbi:MAG: hypothetical protein ACI8Y4_005216 [Candidatus Poriferisodalaceae bacterium]|jgi:hypothetical protein